MYSLIAIGWNSAQLAAQQGWAGQHPVLKTQEPEFGIQFFQHRLFLLFERPLTLMSSVKRFNRAQASRMERISCMSRV
jgi:hypothetical protein